MTSPHSQTTLEVGPIGALENEREPRPVLTIAWHPEIGRTGEQALVESLTDSVVQISRLEPTFADPIAGRQVGPLEARALSRTPLVIERRGDGLFFSTAARCPIAVDGVPVVGELRRAWSDLDRGVVIELAHQVVLLLHLGHTAAGVPGDDLGLVGLSSGIESVRRQVRAVAGLDVPVLIRGPTGSGKELVARALHGLSARSHRPFVAINMAAIPRSTAESSLFGHERGAFTGASGASPGYFGEADGGTLFLDEIGETPVEIQASLLRTLETLTIQRVGSSRPRTVDVRIIAATDAALEDEISSGRFKAPLLHRLSSSAPIRLPGLRERRDDIPRLFVHHFSQALRRHGGPRRDEPWMPTWFVRQLLDHPWPGNVRQLRNVAEALVIANREPGPFAIRQEVMELLGDHARRTASEPMQASGKSSPSKRGGQALDRDALSRVMTEHRWEVRGAARALGIAPNTLYTRLSALGLHVSADELDLELVEERLRENQGDLAAVAFELRVSLQGLRRRVAKLKRPG